MPQTNLTKTLKELDEIVRWFEEQEEPDVEEGLNKVKVGAELVKRARKRLGELENSFEEIKRQIDEE